MTKVAHLAPPSGLTPAPSTHRAAIRRRAASVAGARHAAYALLTIVGLSTVAAAQVPAQRPELLPAVPEPSAVRLRLQPVGRMAVHVNPTSPVAVAGTLLLIDQSGHVDAWKEGLVTPLLTPKTLPPGIKPIGKEWLLNAAGNRDGTRVYSWYVIVEFRFDGTALSAPRAVVALQARSEGHMGGGLAVDAEGHVLLAVGDNGDSFEDGRTHGQSATTRPDPRFFTFPDGEAGLLLERTGEFFRVSEAR